MEVTENTITIKMEKSQVTGGLLFQKDQTYYDVPKSLLKNVNFYKVVKDDRTPDADTPEKKHKDKDVRRFKDKQQRPDKPGKNWRTKDV